MFLMSVLILCVLISCSLAHDSRSKIDYEFYILQNLFKEAEQRIITLKGIVDAAGNTVCLNFTCANGWISYEGSFYLFEYNKARYFNDAKVFCEQFGANLLHVNDEPENNFILGVLKQFNVKNWWLGCTDKGTEGHWRWVDTNTAVEFTAWAPGQPGVVEDCAGYLQYDSFRWHDIFCTEKLAQPICEKRLFKKNRWHFNTPRDISDKQRSDCKRKPTRWLCDQ